MDDELMREIDEVLADAELMYHAGKSIEALLQRARDRLAPDWVEGRFLWHLMKMGEIIKRDCTCDENVGTDIYCIKCETRFAMQQLIQAGGKLGGQAAIR
jgi:hypothetical protein